MRRSKLNIYLYSILSILLFNINGTLFAQTQSDNKITLEVKESIHNKYPNIINTIVKIKNESDTSFKGHLSIEEAKDINAILDSNKEIIIEPQDSIFIPVKLNIKPICEAGKHTIVYKLLNDANQIQSKGLITISVDQKKSLLLFTESPNVFITNANDSVRIKAFVENKGNQDEDITVVCIIPETINNQIFPEIKFNISPSEKKEINFNFLLPPELRNQQQFRINIYGSSGIDKKTFGNLSISVLNIASDQSYRSNTILPYDSYFNYTQNSLDVSFRQMGNNSYMTQIRGGGSVDLPAGYIDFKGNLYKMNTQDEYYMSNTSLAYRLNGNEFLVGNLSENFELNLFGRGAKLSLTNSDQSKQVSVGFIENNFNILDKSKLLSNGYGSYVTFKSGIRNVYRGTSTSIVYQNDNFEQSRNYMLSNELRYAIGTNWLFTLNTHGVISRYDILKNQKVAGASEFKYRGNIGDFNMSGNFYISSSYFPSSRKGLTSVTQYLERRLANKGLLRATILYYKSVPRSYNYDITAYNKSLRTDIGIILPKSGNLSPSFSYQMQNETVNGYENYFNIKNTDLISMRANRLVEQVSWTSRDFSHLIIASIENGLVKYPYSDKLDLQFKASTSYTNNWLVINSTYQLGSYYISEYALAQERGKRFYRFSFSTSFNKSFANDKYIINVGQNMRHDLIAKFTPSAFANAIYNSSRKTAFYLNTSWYRYQFSGIVSNIFNIEVGFTIKFNGHKPSSGKKSKIAASVFYDNNANQIFDEGDLPANDYNLMIEKRPFISDEKGKIFYKNVPYGKYKIQPTSQKGWFYNGDTIEVNKHNMQVSIPLQQTGTIIGLVTLIYDKNKSKDTDFSKNGFRFIIKNKENEVVSQSIISDEEGRFVFFIPPGEYVIYIDSKSLPVDMEALDTSFPVTVQSMKRTTLPDFRVKVKNKTINIKKFTQ